MEPLDRARRNAPKYSQREHTLMVSLLISVIISSVLLICYLSVDKNDGSVCSTPECTEAAHHILTTVDQTVDPCEGGSVCSTPECIEAAHHILTTVDQTVDPCEDFYKFSCGNFLKDTIVKNLASPFKPLLEMAKNGLKQIVIEKLKNETYLPKSLRDQRKFYRACMNTTAIEEDQAFLAVLKEVIGGLPLYQGYTKDLYWSEIMVRAREKGVKFDFFLRLDAAYVPSERSFYIQVSPPQIKDLDLLLEVNFRKIAAMAKWRNTTVSRATWEMRKTMEFAKNLKQIVEKADEETKIWTLGRKKTMIFMLKTISPLQLDWLKFLKNMTNLTNLKTIDIILLNASEKYLKDLYNLISNTKAKIWVNYIALVLITDKHKFLSNKIENTWTATLLSPLLYSDRTEFCSDASITLFKGVAESQYIRKVLTEEKREQIKKIIKNIKAELKDAVKINKWMDTAAKESAIKHLNSVTELIGWTDTVFNETEFEKVFGFDKLNIESDRIITIFRQVSKSAYDIRFRRIGTKYVTKYFDLIFITPLFEVNAFYAMFEKMLILCVPILHPPIYDHNRPGYMNYGSLGSIIGHELTHVVTDADDSLKIFGTLDYWIRLDKEEAECINDEYDRYVGELEGNFANATETLLENIADFTGPNLAYQAYQQWVERLGTDKQLPGVKYSPNQLFWIMASTYLCRDPKLQNLHDEHAVASFRVFGPIRNSPYFGKDFGCPEGSNMNPKKKCRLFL